MKSHCTNENTIITIARRRTSGRIAMSNNLEFEWPLLCHCSGMFTIQEKAPQVAGLI